MSGLPRTLHGAARLLPYTLVGLLLAGCGGVRVAPPADATPPTATAPAAAEGAADFVIVQLNDVYEISPLEGGRVGGMARVGTVVRRLERANPNTIVVLAGDFLSPSLIGSLETQGPGACRPIAGAQMVAAMNAVGVDYVAFGNHEFDLSEPCLQARIDESEFAYVAANVRRRTGDGVARFVHATGGPIGDYAVHPFPLADADTARLALIGLTLPFNEAKYVAYEDATAAAARALPAAAAASDVAFALTHQSLDEDRALARALPSLPLILGGHEHEAMEHVVGWTRIAKADANARTIYVHSVTLGEDPSRPEIRSELVAITDTIAEDPDVARVVAEWEAKADALVSAMGYDGGDSIAHFAEPYDGREAMIRTRPTNLGRLVADAMLAADPAADLALMNSGSIRLDDELRGTVVQRDVLRMLPFGGPIVHGTLSGELLARALETGVVTNAGNGGYLQLSSNIGGGPGRWTIDREPLDAARDYAVVLPAFVAAGKEANLGFLANDPSIYRPLELTGVGGTPRNDLRDVVILYVKGR